MAFRKIIPSDYNDKDVSGLPNQPTISPTALKQRFDAPAKEVVAPAVNSLIDALEASTAATDMGAVAPLNRTGTTIQGVMNSISSDLDTTALDVANLQVEAHSHPNKGVIDELSDAAGELYYNGSPIGKTDYDNLDNRPSINGTTLTGDKSSADLGIVIPDELADLSDDTDHRLVSDAEKTAWNGKIDNGVKNIKVGANTIVTSGEDTIEFKPGSNVTLSANTSDKTITISASGGGGGGGGDMYKIDYDSNSDGVVNEADTATTLTGLTASIADLNYVAGVTSGIQSQLDGKLDATISSPQAGQQITYDGTKFTNTDPDKSVVRYAGSITLAALETGYATYLTSLYEDKFFLITTGGQIADGSKWTDSFNTGDEIPVDSHIAVLNVGTEQSPDYRFDDFGGYIDISGKADKSELPVQITRTSVTVASGSDVRIPASGTNSAIKTTSKIIPVCDKLDGTDTPAKFSKITVDSNGGFLNIKMAEALSGATVGIIVFNE